LAFLATWAHCWLMFSQLNMSNVSNIALFWHTKTTAKS